MIVLRCPHAKIEAKNAEISISCSLLNRLGIEIGSFATKSLD
jgi:hypothetical protein